MSWQRGLQLGASLGSCRMKRQTQQCPPVEVGRRLGSRFTPRPRCWECGGDAGGAGGPTFWLETSRQRPSGPCGVSRPLFPRPRPGRCTAPGLSLLAPDEGALRAYGVPEAGCLRCRSPAQRCPCPLVCSPGAAAAERPGLAAGSQRSQTKPEPLSPGAPSLTRTHLGRCRAPAPIRLRPFPMDQKQHWGQSCVWVRWMARKVFLLWQQCHCKATAVSVCHVSSLPACQWLTLWNISHFSEDTELPVFRMVVLLKWLFVFCLRHVGDVL